MKSKFNILVCILAFVLAFTACGGKTALAEEQAKQLAEKHTQLMLDGDFAAVLNESSDAVKKRLDAQAMEAAWNQVTALAGEYENIHSVEYSQANGYATVRVTAYFTASGVIISYVYNADGIIEGINLNLTSREEKIALTDTEKFCEKEITVGEYALKGIVTLPKNKEGYPVAVLVQGSGASDCDETVGANKPFREIAHALAEKGIATVRVNKRFYQLPQLASEKGDTLTIYDEYMDDVYAAIDYAKENVSNTVFVIGHSQGGMSAPKIMQDKDLAGAVIMAGTIRGLEDVVFDQNMRVLEAGNYPDSEKNALTQQIMDEVRKVKNLTADDKSAPLGIPASYWLSLRDLDAENILKKTDRPVLLMQGTRDFQVYEDKDYQHMLSVLKDNKNISYRCYDGLNHLFMPQAQPGVIDVTEYAQPNHIPRYVTDDIAQFILDNF